MFVGFSSYILVSLLNCTHSFIVLLNKKTYLRIVLLQPIGITRYVLIVVSVALLSAGGAVKMEAAGWTPSAVSPRQPAPRCLAARLGGEEG